MKPFRSWLHFAQLPTDAVLFFWLPVALAILAGCGGRSSSLEAPGRDEQPSNLSGTGPSVVSLSPSFVFYGTQLLGTSGPQSTVTLTNSGGSALTINSIAVAGANSSDFGVTHNCPISPNSLAAGNSCTLQATFTAQAAGPRKSSISISAGTGVQAVLLTGVGTAISSAPGSLTFSSQPVGTPSSSMPVTITNGGGTAVNLWQIAFVGANAGDFSHSNTSTCGNSLGAGANCTVNVIFSPAEAGSRTASLLISDEGGGSPQAVTLAGTGTSGESQAPTIFWTGDSQVSAGIGDHGIATAGPPGVVVVPDGSGGAFIAWEDDANLVVGVQHVDTNGHHYWQDPGPQVTNVNAYQASPRAVPDGSGGVIVAWVDGRRSPGFCSPSFKTTCDIFAQRINSSGQVLWDPAGVPIATVGNNATGAAMIPDGGGAILSWEGGATGSMYAQLIDWSGRPRWPVNGVQVSPTPTIDLGATEPPRMVSDGAGGAVISWWNIQYSSLTTQPTVSAQHVNTAGQLTWDVAGVTVTPIRQQNASDYDMTADGSGGAIFLGANPNINMVPAVWTMTVQRVNSAGQNTWGASGNPLIDEYNPTLAPVATSDGAGGAFLAWQSCDVQGPNCQIKAQHVAINGATTWSIVQITNIPGGRNGPHLLADGNGGVVTIWTDCRNGTPSDCGSVQHIYAQRINATGSVLWQPDGFPITIAPGNQGVNYAGGVSGVAAADDGQGGAILAWPDGRNQLCSLTDVPSRCDLFAQRISF